MHQGKDGLAFVEALLAQKIYFRKFGLDPSSGATGSGSAVPASSRKHTVKQYINSSSSIIVCHFLTTLFYVTLEIFFDNFLCIKY
jgi:hypothetical protein